MQHHMMFLLSVSGVLIVFSALRALRLHARDTAFGRTGLALLMVAIALAAVLAQARRQPPGAGAGAPPLVVVGDAR